MRNLLYILFLIPLLSLSQSTATLVDADILAFPGAIGHGKDADGFRGRSVYFVTNTTDGTGAGTFQKALSDASTAGGGYIIFKTGGVLTYTGDPDIDDNIYIAGQTAPGGGYGVRAANDARHQIWVRGSEVVIRHLRWYGGDATGQDCLTVGSTSSSRTTNMTNVVIDHNSFHWAYDENVSFITFTGNMAIADPTYWTNPKWTISNVSFTNNIVGEQFSSGYGLIIYNVGKTNFSLIRNLFINHADRSPLNNGVGNTMEYINNFVNYGTNTGTNKLHPQSLSNIIGNVHRPRVQYDNATYRINECSTDNCPPSGESDYTGTQTYYTDNLDDKEAGGIATYNPDMTPYLQGGVITSIESGYTALSSSVVQDTLVASAGAGVGTIQPRDSLDLVYMEDIALDTGRYTQSDVGNGVGEPPTLAAGTGYTDTDSDGLSDTYETAQGGTTTSIVATIRPATAVLSDGNTVDQSGVTSYASAGYTHLDIFLADMAGDWDGFTFVPDAITPPGLRAKPKGIKVGTTGGGAYLGTNKIKG